MGYIEKYNEWCNSPFFDEETKQELLNMRNDEGEIKDSFYQDLEFGTAGLRGVVGAGTNRMNKYTVGTVTQGLANYILKKGYAQDGVVIGYDSRNSSAGFSNDTALILCANGIKTYVFSEPRPLPELSFAIRELGSISGVMITASHNPPKYNGYKVFWEDGSQIVEPVDSEITHEISNVRFEDIKTISKKDAIEAGLYETIGTEMDDKYIEALKQLSLNPGTIKEMNPELKIVYTPLHGGRRNYRKKGTRSIWL